MKSMRVTPTRLFLILTVILSYITASGIWLIHFAPNLIGSSSEFEVVAGFFGVSVWLIASACLALSVIGLPATSRAPTDPMHIDDRLRMIGAEPAYLTVVFKLPSLNDAQPLIAQLPYGQKALGTEAVVFGMTTGNLMEVEPCAD